jgi:hypothetical protein
MSYLFAIPAVIALLAVAGFILVFIGFPWLAKEDVLFTNVKEGTVKGIVRGKTFDRFIMSFAGYHLNDPSKEGYREDRPKWEVLYHGDKNTNDFKGDEMKDGHYDKRHWLLKHLGLYWVGWPWANSVYVYQFEWNETITDRGTGAEKILPRAEPTDFIYVADFTYAIKTVGAETKDRLPTDELTLVTVAIRNPYRALFTGEDWMRRITSSINRHVRSFIGVHDFQDLVQGTRFKGREKPVEGERIGEEVAINFSGPIIELNEKLPDDKDPPLGLKGRYGVVIRTADLQSVELSGEAKKQDQEATTREYVARQQAKATLVTGQAEADVIKMRGDREAEALGARLKVIQEYGDAGITLAGYDAIQDASKNPGSQTIWANNPLGALAGLLKPQAKGDEK